MRHRLRPCAAPPHPSPRRRSVGGRLRRVLGRVLGHVACGGILALAGCERSTPDVASDSAQVPRDAARPDVPMPEPSTSGWDDSAGSFLVLPTVDDGIAAGSLLLPEAADSTVGDTTGVATRLGDGRLDLFARSGRVGGARLTVERSAAAAPGCTAWPVARLAVEAGVAPTPWTAAFPAGRVTAVVLDSIEGLAPRDSASLAATLTRLASRLPDDTSATFRALPFVVLRAWRAPAAQDAIVVAVLARRVNQEDNPLEERVVLVVDAQGADAKAWRVGWHERASGHEEELVVAEPLLAYRTTGANDLHLLFGRDDGDALSAAILIRRGAEWTVLWESAIAGCG